MKLSERLNRTGKAPAKGGPAETADAVLPPQAAATPAAAPAGVVTTKKAAEPPPVRAAVGGAAPRRTTASATPTPVRRATPGPAKRGAAVELTGLDSLRAKVRSSVIAELGPKLGGGTVDESVVRALLERHLNEAMVGSRVTVGPTERAKFIDTTLADMLGWGVLTPLMADPEVTEIMVNGLDSVYIERAGVISRTDVRFPTMTDYRTVIDRMLAVAGRRIDEASPMADGRLPDGSRINAIIPPLVVGDPVLTVRRFPEIAFTIEDLVVKGSLSREAADFLRLAIEGKLNVIVSGGTGTGKTTLLNVLSGAIPERERVITIEDAAELRMSQPHVVSLEARPANIEGVGHVSIRDLVRNALRMRPDRIIVGEVRDAAALDMLQAMNTGHEGSMTTVHANSPRDALSRVETMVLMAGIELPLRAIREQVSSAIDMIVQLDRQNDGSRVVSAVTEVQGREGDTITLQDIFTRTGEGPLAATGLRPRCIEKVENRGVKVPSTLFRKTAAATVKRRASTR
ncbi:MAG: CpaF family protein [Mycobacteriales bacterium]|nr:CpaF family protein [Mycobacteriales bacterium]